MKRTSAAARGPGGRSTGACGCRRPSTSRSPSFPKDLIVFHHTAGGSAPSTFDWWQTGQPQRIASAYLVERDGTVFEVFDPCFWAFHLGLAGTGGRVDRRSIGIELASEGWLEERDGKLLAYGQPFGGAVYDHGEPWREHRFFAA